jgi:hypothetical protein
MPLAGRGASGRASGIQRQAAGTRRYHYFIAIRFLRGDFLGTMTFLGVFRVIASLRGNGTSWSSMLATVRSGLWATTGFNQ